MIAIPGNLCVWLATGHTFGSLEAVAEPMAGRPTRQALSKC